MIESMFIKAGDIGTKSWLKIEEDKVTVTGVSLGWAA